MLIAAIALTITGDYPKSLFDFILGLNRWVIRVTAYAALMTDRYPPFRLDVGGADPGGRVSVRPPSPAPAGPGGSGWTPGRVICLVIGSVLALISLGLFAGGGSLLWAQAHRQDGYLTSPAVTYATPGYVLASESIELHAGGWDWVGSMVGRVRIRVTAPGPARPVFLGIAPAPAAARYLAGVRYTTVTSLSGGATADEGERMGTEPLGIGYLALPGRRGWLVAAGAGLLRRAHPPGPPWG